MEQQIKSKSGETDTILEIVGKDIENLKICENCGRPVNIKTNKGHKEYCGWVWGRRGWRQLGIYDG